MRRRLSYPPLTLFWPVQEEVGLHGAQFARLAALGNPKLAFNWDGGTADKITIGATGAYRLKITITGVASHAGASPKMTPVSNDNPKANASTGAEGVVLNGR